MSESNIDVEYVSLFEKYISEMSLDKQFKKELAHCFSCRKERLREITKQISIDQNFTGEWKDFLTNVADGSILFIGSRRDGTYLFGTLHNKNGFLEFDGLFQDGCYNQFCDCLLIGKESGKSIRHHIFIDEHKHRLIIKGVIFKCYDNKVYHFKF